MPESNTFPPNPEADDTEAPEPPRFDGIESRQHFRASDASVEAVTTMLTELFAPVMQALATRIETVLAHDIEGERPNPLPTSAPSEGFAGHPEHPSRGADIPFAAEGSDDAMFAEISRIKAEGESAREAAAEKHAALLADGAGALGALARTWINNFGVLDAPQPDRIAALVAAFAGYHGGILAYVRERGGLVTAIVDVLVSQNLTAPLDANLLARKVALNMVQVGSTQGLALDRLVEASFYAFRIPDDVPPEGRDDALAAIPLRGGPAMDAIDFTVPPTGNYMDAMNAGS